MAERFKKILVLGNEAFIQSLIELLRKNFKTFQFISAFSIEAAESLIDEAKPLFIISSVNLLDGSVIDWFKKNTDFPGLILYQNEKAKETIADLVSQHCSLWRMDKNTTDELLLFIHQALQTVECRLQLKALSQRLNQTRNELKQKMMKHAVMDSLKESDEPFSQAEHQLVEEALRESELMYRTLFESAPVGMCLATIDGNVFGYNEAMQKLIGDSAERSLENFNLSQLFPRAEDYDALLHEVQTMGFIRDIEGELVNSEGYVFYAIMNITFLTIGEEDFLLTVFEDITMRKLAEEKLGDYTEQLREVNAELYQYAYAVAHDIRAPLRAIRNYADFLNEDLAGNLQEEQQEYLDNMVKSVNDAEKFVADLLELSRVGRREVHIEPIHLKQLVYDLEASLDLSENMKVNYPDDLPVVMGEHTLLKQIFLNLITNGLKFNQSAVKEINFTWQDVDSQYVEIRIQDNGIGIKPEYHEQIFRVFERLHTKQEYDGTGVGLAIVKKAVLKMQGQVQLESNAGQGSTFIISLLKSV